MSMQTPNRCANCDANLARGQEYCAVCGQKDISERLTLHEIARDLIHAVFHVDRSVLSLLRMLLLRPGTVALDYVRGKRKRYFGPFAFLLVVVAAASALVAFTGFHAVVTNSPNVIAAFLQTHVNLVMLEEVPLLAGITRLVDARGGFNFAEHLVLAAYTSGIRILFFMVIVIPGWYLLQPNGPTAERWYYIYLLVWLVYFGFAASNFFRGNRAASWCKGVAAAVFTWILIQVVTILATSLLFGLSTRVAPPATWG
jgi:hypothetical protein